jgi:hypothetical protein
VLKAIVEGDRGVFGAKLVLKFDLVLRWSSLCGRARGDGKAGVS